MPTRSVRFKIILPAALFIIAVMTAILSVVFLVTKQVSEDYQQFKLAGQAAQVRGIIDTAINEVVSALLISRLNVNIAYQKTVLEQLAAFWNGNGLNGLVVQGDEIIASTTNQSESLDKILRHAAQPGYFSHYHSLSFVSGYVIHLPAWNWKILISSPPINIIKRNTVVFFLLPLIAAGGLLLLWGILAILHRNLERPVEKILRAITGGAPVAMTGVAEMDRIGQAINETIGALKKRTDQLQLLHDVSASVHHLTTAENFLHNLLAKAIATLGAAQGAVAIFEPAGSELTYFKKISSSDDDDNRQICRDLMRRARLIGAPVVSNDGDSDNLLDGFVKCCCPTVSNFLTYPLTSSKGLADLVFVFGNKPDSFADDDVSFIGALAADAMTAVEKLRAEETLKKALNDLESQNIRLKELDRMKDGLIRDVSHELKTPVAKQAMHLELLRHSLGRQCLGNVDKVINVMEAAVKRQQLVISNLLDLSRLEAGGRKFVYGPVRIDGVLQAVLDDYRFSIETSGITLTTSWQPLTIWGDGEMLWHVFSNLINNAIKFKPKDAPGKIDITVNEDYGQAVVAVRDNGVGLSRLEKKHVFDRFYQASASVEGTGVGLTICKAIIDEMGGDIFLDSAGPGQGAVAVVRLPLAPTPVAAS